MTVETNGVRDIDARNLPWLAVSIRMIFSSRTHVFSVEPWVRSFKLLARVGQELLENTVLVWASEVHIRVRRVTDSGDRSPSPVD